MTTRRARHVIVPIIACMAVVVLAGCQAVDRTALRLNEDGSFDFGVCGSLSDITGGEVLSYLDESDASPDRVYLSTDDLPEDLNAGDIVHLPAPHSDDWDRVQVAILGDYTSRAGEAYATTMTGLFERGNLQVGEWSWARSGVFIGTVPVEGCDLSS